MKKIFVAADIVVYNNSDYIIDIESVCPANGYIVDKTKINSKNSIGYTVSGYGTIHIHVYANGRHHKNYFVCTDNIMIYIDDNGLVAKQFNWR